MPLPALINQSAWIRTIREAFGCSSKRKNRQADSELEVLKKEIEEMAKAIPGKFAPLFKDFKERCFERIEGARPSEMKKVAEQIAAKELIPRFKRMKRKDLDEFPNEVPSLLGNVLETERFSQKMRRQKEVDRADLSLEERIEKLSLKGRFGEAARLIRALNGEKARKKHYFELGKALYQANCRADVLEEMDQDPEMELDDKEEVLAAICRDCVSQNRLREARSIADRLQIPRFQSLAEGHLADHFIKSGDLESAEPHAEKIKDLNWRSEFLNILSLRHLQKRSPLRAHKAAEKIPQEPYKSNALLKVFEYFKERSHVYLAYFSTCKMESSLKAEKRADLFLDCLSKNRKGFESDLKKLLNSISDSKQQTRALKGYFMDFLQKKDYGQARAIAATIPDEEVQTIALKHLFRAQLSDRKIDDCLEIAGEFPLGNDQSNACIALIDRVLKTQQFPRAVRMANAIKDPDVRAKQQERIRKEENWHLTAGWI